jgi:hypothetical protein
MILQERQQEPIEHLYGHINSNPPRCDCYFTLFPLSRAALYYIFNLSDDEFPASATCLFPSNAAHFLLVAGLAETVEYTAKKIIKLVKKEWC